jgi:hypothetical protein
MRGRGHGDDSRSAETRGEQEIAAGVGSGRIHVVPPLANEASIPVAGMRSISFGAAMVSAETRRKTAFVSHEIQRASRETECPRAPRTLAS